MSTVHSFQGHGRVIMGSGSVTTTALAAAAEEVLTIADSNAQLNDQVNANFDVAARATAGSVVIHDAWVSAAGTISFLVGNVHASDALDAGAKTIIYSLSRAS